jgi:hypothetical protein
LKIRSKDGWYIFPDRISGFHTWKLPTSRTRQVVRTRFSTDFDSGDYSISPQLDFVHPIVHCQLGELPVFPAILRATAIFAMSLSG